MAEPMHPLLQGEPHPLKGSIEELPPHSRLPRLDLAIDWESPQEEFAASVRDFFAGPRAPKDGELPPEATRCASIGSRASRRPRRFWRRACGTWLPSGC